MKTKTRKCFISELYPDLQAVLSKYLDGNEEILICFETKRQDRLLGIIPMTDSVMAQIITEKRMIKISYSHVALAGRPSSDRIVDPESILLADIVQCRSFWDQYMGNCVKAVGHGAEMVMPFESGEDQREWIATLESAKEKVTAVKAEPNSRIFDSLRNLAQLHKEELITDEEFAAKRRQLLDEL